MKEPGKQELPQFINFEFSAVCNMKCRWCALDHGKKPVFLDPGLFERALQEMADWRSEAAVIRQVDFHNSGETLLHPQLETMLTLIEEYRPLIEAQKFFLLTNGLSLTGKRARWLAACSGLDRVRVSIDGGTKELYEWIRGPHWETVKRNFTAFAQLARDLNPLLELQVICLVPPDKPLSQDWMEPDFREVIKQADIVSLRHPHGWVGDCEIPVDPARKKPEEMCKFLLHNLVVLASGEVTVCCADLNAQGVIGNLQNEGLKDLWFGENRLSKLRAWQRGEFETIKPCATCEGYYDLM